MQSCDSAHRGLCPAFGEFRGSGCVVMGPFADVRALAGRLLSRDRPGAVAGKQSSSERTDVGERTHDNAAGAPEFAEGRAEPTMCRIAALHTQSQSMLVALRLRIGGSPAGARTNQKAPKEA